MSEKITFDISKAEYIDEDVLRIPADGFKRVNVIQLQKELLAITAELAAKTNSVNARIAEINEILSKHAALKSIADASNPA